MTTMRKYLNWEPLYHEAVQQRQKEPFVMGVTDCVPTVCDILKVCTGVDLMDGWRGAYTDHKSMFKLVQKEEGGLLGMLRRKFAELGVAEIPVRQARRLDIAYLDETAAQEWVTRSGALGLFDAQGIIITGKMGLVSIPRSIATYAWRVL